jgi:hypothetical protein
MRKIFLVGIIAGLSVSCEQKVETIVTEVPALSASSIYKADSVLQYKEKYGVSHSVMAESYLTKATEGSKEKIEKAIYCLKRAITLDPQLESYKKLGKLLETAKSYDEMFKVYDFVTSTIYLQNKPDVHYVFGMPDEDMFYETLVSEYLANKSISAYSIYKANDTQKIQMSNLKKRLQSEPRINMDTASIEWKNLMLQFLSPEEAKDYVQNENVFGFLRKSILDSSSVFSIDENKVQDFNYRESEEREYEDMDYGGNQLATFYSNFLVEKKAQANYWYNYNFTHKIKISDDINAIIYSIDTSALACPKSMRHIYHHLVTYNKKGEIIDNKVIATQAGEKLSTLKFVENKFVISNYKRTWKKPYNKNDFDNYLVNTEAMGEESYEIGSDGKIKKSKSDS